MERGRPSWNWSGRAYTPNVDATEAEHAGARADLGDLLRDGLSLLNIAADNAGVGAEVDEGPSLGAADGSRAASDEEDAVG
jgi:hypothetical protein